MRIHLSLSVFYGHVGVGVYIRQGSRQEPVPELYLNCTDAKVWAFCIQSTPEPPTITLFRFKPDEEYRNMTFKGNRPHTLMSLT